MSRRSRLPGNFMPARSAAILVLWSASVFLSACRAHDFPNYSSRYREYAYVSNSAGNTVTVLDLVNLRLDRVIQVGSRPGSLAANPTKNEVYVANTGSSTVSIIDAEKNAVVATLPVRRDPASISVDSSGRRAYISNAGSNSVSVLDLNTRRDIATIGVGEQPVMARVTPDDHRSRRCQSRRQ